MGKILHWCPKYVRCFHCERKLPWRAVRATCSWCRVPIYSSRAIPVIHHLPVLTSSLDKARPPPTTCLSSPR